MIRRIREVVRQGRLRFTGHALEEMADDEIESRDVERIILTGRVSRKFTRDPRGTRYEVTGYTEEGRPGAVVCRFVPGNVLLIITAYAE